MTLAHYIQSLEKLSPTAFDIGILLNNLSSGSKINKYNRLEKKKN